MTKAKSFFKDIFNKNKRQEIYDNLSYKYNEEAMDFYNEILSGLERLYFHVYGQEMQLSPLTPLRNSYDDLFNQDVKNDFNIYSDGARLTLKRKTLEDVFDK